MDYKIIRAFSETGQIEVAYLYGGKTVGTYAIDVPVLDGAFLTGDALDAEIKHRAPTWLVQREQEVSTAVGFEQIEALVDAPAEKPVDPQEVANLEMWAQEQFDKQVAASLVRFGVLSSDPTTIPTVKL